MERKLEEERGLDDAESFLLRVFGVSASLYTELYTLTLRTARGFILTCC